MRAPGYSPFLFLMLALIPQPGVSQGGSNWKHCQDCKKLLTDASMTASTTDRFYQNLIKNAEYEDCPNNVARFKLPRGIFCGVRGETWVENVIGCINQGREPCLKPSENQQDHSKGEKPPSTTQETTTSTSKAAPSPRESIQTWEGGTQNSSESVNKNLGTTQKTLKTTIGPTTAAPNSDLNNAKRHGNNIPPDEKDEESKSKNMTIAIISLIIIVLVMTSVVMYFVCRKKKISECRTTLNTDVNMVYQQELLKEPEEQEPDGGV